VRPATYRFWLATRVGSENGMAGLLDRSTEAARGLPRRHGTISPALFCGLPEAMMLYRPWRLRLGSARPSWRRKLLRPAASLRPMNRYGRCGARTDRAASLWLNARHYRRRSPQGARRLWSRIQNIVDLLLLYPDIGTSIDDPTIRRMTTSPCPIAFFTRRPRPRLPFTPSVILVTTLPSSSRDDTPIGIKGVRRLPRARPLAARRLLAVRRLRAAPRSPGQAERHKPAAVQARPLRIR
jgi:hypothetical protein